MSSTRSARTLGLAGATLAATALASLSPGTAAAAACPADAGDCTPLFAPGSLAANIDVVIVGDGYTAGERDKFLADAKKIAEGLVKSETYGSYEPLFNAWALFTPSNESGADDPSEGVSVDTVYGASFDTQGISQALWVPPTKVLLDVSKRFPEKDLVMCIVNTEQYGGTGGPVATISMHELSLDIARHEIGHTLANLADEYEDPYPGYPEGDGEPNVVDTSHLSPIEWSAWITDGTAIPTPDSAAEGDHDPIGAYEGARYLATGMFRPGPTCLMRALGVTFCPVCAEAMVLSIARRTLLIDQPSPPSFSSIPAKGATTFTAVIPALADLSFAWKLDGAPVEGATAGSLDVDPTALGLADGQHTVELTVNDQTPLVRTDPEDDLIEVYTWTIAVDSSLPPAGTGGSGGSGGGGAGGGSAGGSSEGAGACACRTAGGGGDGAGWGGASAWWLLGAAPLLRWRRRRAASPSRSS